MGHHGRGKRDRQINNSSGYCTGAGRAVPCKKDWHLPGRRTPHRRERRMGEAVADGQDRATSDGVQQETEGLSILRPEAREGPSRLWSDTPPSTEEDQRQTRCGSSGEYV